jgi:hypothetical protein
MSDNLRTSTHHDQCSRGFIGERSPVNKEGEWTRYNRVITDRHCESNEVFNGLRDEYTQVQNQDCDSFSQTYFHPLDMHMARHVSAVVLRRES